MIRNLTLTLLLAALCCAPADAVTFDWATVGDPNNADDTHGAGYGGVDYTYRISKHEVTNAQYVEFLNAKDSTGVNSLALYSSQMSTSWNTAGIDFTFDLSVISSPLLAAHIHSGTPGVNGPILVPLFEFCDLAPAELDDFKPKLVYVDRENRITSMPKRLRS